MKITSQQAHMLLEVLRASLDYEIPGTFKESVRRKLYLEILEQQSAEIVDLDGGLK